MAAERQLICASDRLVDGGAAVCFDVPCGGGLVPAFAVRCKGSVYGWLNQCAHLPMPMDLMPGKLFDQSGLYLVCATHGALYLPDSGLCVAGPCVGAALVPVGVEECKGFVYRVQAVQ